MKWLVLLLFTFSFGLLAAAGPDPDACGDPVMPPPVDKISCGDSLSDLGCKWYSDYISCIQRCRHQKSLNRLIYHNHRYYDISVQEYDKIMDAEAKASACKTKTAVATKATKKAGASSTGKKSGFKTVTRTITHLARQPSLEAEVAGTQTFSTLFRTVTPTVTAQTSNLAATQTSSDSWSTSTKATEPSATRAAEPEDEDEDEPHHPRLDFYCQKTSQVAKCRTKCGWHIFGGFPKCMKKCHAKCHKKHPVHPDGKDLALVEKRDDSTPTFSTSWRIVTPTVTKTVQPSATEVAEPEDEEPQHHPRIDHYCSKEIEMYKCRQKCAHHDFIFGIGKKKCEHKCHERCYENHPLFPDGNGPGLVNRADNETVIHAALEQAIGTVLDTAIHTVLNQTSVLANTTNLNLNVKRSEGHNTPYCSSDNVIMGCKARAQLWAPAYDTIFKKCINRCIRRHGID
ncbi:hypothetical protein KCU77_g6058, partial [Aureobasidium melanogenum]